MGQHVILNEKATALMDEWLQAQRRVNDLNVKLLAAQSEMEKAASKMAEWMIPADAEVGEAFNVLIDGGILTARKHTVPSEVNGGELETHYTLAWRKK